VKPIEETRTNLHMPDQHEKWLKVLGLVPGASEQAVREAYRDLVKVWHPDRFGTDERLRQKAEERLRDLNDAFAHLQGYRPAQSDRDSSTRASGAPNRPDASSSTGRRLSISGRMARTLVVSCGVAALAVWFVLGAHREGPSGASLESQARDPVASPQPEKRQAARVAVRRAAPQPQSSSAPATGSLRVESQPTGARISLDGESMGDTPLVVTDITPGEHQIALDLGAGGYRRWSSSVVVTAGREEKLLAVMTAGTTPR